MSLEKRKGIKRLTSSINHSLAGFVNALLTEDAFRQLFIISAILLVIALFLDVTKIERLFLISSCFLLLMVELLNTAIETVIDRISLDIHPLSKRAKDLGGAAQLVTVVMTIIIWLIVLL
ncbi:diacylglycerol kinase [Erwinia endophytica]|uniref:diacylglycerol kinase n=1 Tax=Erwinia endophytica TaxID=1563158 RepID=UPI001265FDB8|nr:diacylglycerol kinase [Erwinia endophytica]KAB8307417.1 diacylglycerol kinase [Erwinia endophytica]